jgi:hypothetical protein
MVTYRVTLCAEAPGLSELFAAAPHRVERRLRLRVKVLTYSDEREFHKNGEATRRARGH